MVVGGNGFVGSHICKLAVEGWQDDDISVVSVSRSGTKKLTDQPWIHKVKWLREDAFHVENWWPELEGIDSVVSCLGAFGSTEYMEKLNGDANIALVEKAKKCGVKRFIYISAYHFWFTEPVLKGYYKGKHKAEERVMQLFPDNHLILQPGFIFGKRPVQLGSWTLSLPLEILGQPLGSIVHDGIKSLFPQKLQTFPHPVDVDMLAWFVLKNAFGGVNGVVLPNTFREKTESLVRD